MFKNRIKNKIYNFTLPQKIKLVPQSLLYKVIGKPATFDVLFVAGGTLQRLEGITSEEFSGYPITSLMVTKCPLGTVIR